MFDTTTVCIVQPRVGVLTETFIDAHYRHLRSPVFRLECDPYPSHSEDGWPLFSLGHPTIHRWLGRLAGLDELHADRALSRRLPSRVRQYALARHLRRRSVDVVLAEYGPTGVAIHDACLSAGIPMVIHFHGYDAYYHDVLRENQAAYRRLFADAFALIAVSTDMRRQLIDLGAAPDKVIHNPYGIDIEIFRGANPSRSRALFVAIGRLVEKKAPDLTISAFSKVVEHHPDARLIMIGDGPLTNRCVDLVGTLGLSGKVDLAGPKPHSEVARLMSTARCLVQHSVTPASGDREGTPLAILEAMASGLPVVSTRHGGIVDVVSEGESGLLVEEGDVEGMAAAMARFAASPELAATFGAAARAYVLREHTLRDRIARLEEILKRAAASRR